jgi:hypothetical protein
MGAITARKYAVGWFGGEQKNKTPDLLPGFLNRSGKFFKGCSCQKSQ